MATFVATKIRMNRGSYNSDNLLEIDEIFITNSKDGWYKKAVIHDHVKNFQIQLQ